MKWSISVICILSLYAGYAAAIRCYECDSITNSACEDTFKADGFQPKDDCTTCMKVKGRKDGIQYHAILRYYPINASQKPSLVSMWTFVGAGKTFVTAPLACLQVSPSCLFLLSYL
ncbi:hypothetical protein DPMN_084522 [Dreissena polymorpha]|uniref:Protein quiver n=1 Tax=Dreissena polymorpha TaxID=45954 RepID=A0A9D3YEQ2_DREPO|nr:hypothetical protein DPMN_084522 [Dreissena polymorpha]